MSISLKWDLGEFVFCDGLISFCTMSPEFIHDITDVGISFLLGRMSDRGLEVSGFGVEFKVREGCAMSAMSTDSGAVPSIPCISQLRI